MAALVLLGCQDPSSTATDPGTDRSAPTDGAAAAATRADLEDARARWATAGIDDYTWTYEPVCFCAAVAFDVTVTGSTSTYVAKAGQESALPPGDVTDAEPPYLTVEDLFDTIDAAIDRGPDSMSVEYDDTTGRPVSYGVDPDDDTYDDEMTVRVTAFEAG